MDILWVTLCAGLVFLMQVGFLCLETGFTRSKNNVNVAVKNLTDFCVSSMVFWAVGGSVPPRFLSTTLAVTGVSAAFSYSS
jgi:Amt family ammonium transporter